MMGFPGSMDGQMGGPFPNYGGAQPQPQQQQQYAAAMGGGAWPYGPQQVSVPWQTFW